jgi:hypothetical protein
LQRLRPAFVQHCQPCPQKSVAPGAPIVMHRAIMEKRARRLYKLPVAAENAARRRFNSAILRKCNHD